MGKRSEWHELRQALAEFGYEIRLCPSGHYGIFNAKGTRVYTMCQSPSDWRSYRNTLAQIRRTLGVDIRPKREAT